MASPLLASTRRGSEMTDRELLELAAKAAGWSSWDWLAGDVLNVYSEDGRHDMFNPLADDGDALRLAVKLGMHVSTSAAEVWRNGKEVAHIFEDGTDLYAATRRAIVRAAAALGEKKDA
jgi:hypothetical protein